MDNIEIEISDGNAVITIDLTKRLRASASGKTTVVATTGGNKEIDGTGVYLGLNAYVYPPREMAT